MTDIEEHFLPGVSFEFEGEQVPARELSWAMVASCGCIAGLHMMTTDAMNETAAWKQMSGNAAMIRRDGARGFTIRMVKHRDADFGKCPHNPPYGYMPPPKPAGHSWATTTDARVLHLVPLEALSDEDAKELGREWTVDDKDWRAKASAVCGKETNVFAWTKKWYRTDGKVECSKCLKAVEAQVLL